MNRILKAILQIIGLLLYLGLFILSYWISYLLIPVVVILIICILWMVISRMKRKKNESNYIPDEVMEDFTKAEEMYVAHEGRMQPHEILWKIAQQKKMMKGGIEYGRRRNIEEENTGARIQSSFVKPVRRENIQDNIDTGIADDEKFDNRVKRKRKKDWADFS